MQHSRTYFGEAYLEKSDLEETNIDYKVQLEYYTTKKTEDKKDMYGIEIIKKEHKNNVTDTETTSRTDICDSSQKVIEIINTLKKYKVTPIGLNDVLEDLLKAN